MNIVIIFCRDQRGDQKLSHGTQRTVSKSYILKMENHHSKLEREGGKEGRVGIGIENLQICRFWFSSVLIYVDLGHLWLWQLLEQNSHIFIILAFYSFPYSCKLHILTKANTLSTNSTEVEVKSAILTFLWERLLPVVTLYQYLPMTFKYYVYLLLMNYPVQSS